jgi:NhaP-type Na+/H+ or K+/H+ antiporter
MANTLQFNDEMFFTFILPPIIFAAGYNIRTKAFFKYFMYIFLYGVCGTVITFLVVTPLTAIANSYNLFHLTFNNTQNLPPHFDDDISNNTIFNDTSLNIIDNSMRILLSNFTDPNPLVHHESSSIIKFSLKEILLFASVISATDTVAALTFVKEESDPKLFSILFGEGVLNDAVCIVLYRILFEFTSSGEGKYNFKFRIFL